jgi:hypothetical protein|tara:strand:+ start:4548 stop:5405 length:858 start_codon:yes stop_codon:yes gene_type:complete
MSKLQGLVPDIHQSLVKQQRPNETDLQKFLADVSTSILKAYEERDGEGQIKNPLRFSSIGKPTRQLWYASRIADQAEPIHPSTRIKFLYGDIIEHLVLLLIKTAGYKVTDEQSEKKIDGITGHMDARVNGVVVDIKSASQYGFDKFVKGTIFDDDPFGYIAQLSGYADGEDEAAFIVMNKVTGQLHVCSIDGMEMIDFKKKVKDVKSIVKQETPPDKCYSDIPDGKSGNRKLATGCNYCDFKIHCWKDANGGKGLRKFKYASGSRFFTKVVKRPPKDIKEEKINV